MEAVIAICAAIYLLSQDNFTTRLAQGFEIRLEPTGSVTAMSGSSTCKRIRNSLERFGRDFQGNIAPIFAIALLPVLGFVGAAVDYTRANAARSSMQAALDSAVLMVSKDAAANPTMTSQQITNAVQRYFTSLYNDKSAFGVTVSATYTPSSSSAAAKILASGQGAIQTDFMKIAGFPQLSFGTSSTSTWGNSRMRVALVLDNTGSMSSNGKMSALQRAAKDMIDSLSAFAKKTGDVYISIIPFSKDVNVDTSNYNAAWINWAEWLGEPPVLDPASSYGGSKPSNWDDIVEDSNCPFKKNSHGFTCADRPATLSGAKSDTKRIPSSGKYAGYICPSVDSGSKIPGKAGVFYNGCYRTVKNTIATGSGASCGSTPHCDCSGSGRNKVCTQVLHPWRDTDNPGAAAAAPAAPQPSAAANDGGWTGCINDRDREYDISNTAPSTGSDGTPSTKFYAEQWKDCLPATITAMSSQWSTLKNQIDAMTPSGNTNQSIGLAWGWQSLSTTNGPIAAPGKESGYVYQDYIVLLSDGLNTQNRWYSCPPSGPCPTIDARQALLCQKVKDSGVTIFTIQVNVGSKDPLSQVLQNCASDGNFQMITSATETADAFQNILTQISQLRLAK
ncbi:pilus assembly protein [Nitrobacter sp. Nb-311A]|uniref:TadE/TadG family type IV pilus assembly protein n=1 Tax=Nitrobacter sp. Nb-311A TaxID=314253 RepID=UPI00031DBC73|nr:pilus assembly protein [Nitrobacter sp. Nb-311A]